MVLLLPACHQNGKKQKILSLPFACPAKRSLCDVTKRTDTSASQALAPYSEAALLFCCSCCFILPLSFRGSSNVALPLREVVNKGLNMLFLATRRFFLTEDKSL